MPSAFKWLIGLAAAGMGAALLLLAVESALRWANFGTSTDFLIRRETDSGAWYTSNRAFYQQFFNLPLGAIVHWDDLEFSFPENKSPDTFRVFVFGGSAANGTPPDSAYAFWRALQAMLEDRFPGRRFEFCCVASPGANSHVMTAAARACAQHQPDLFLICMGNNEFIGPFGAGSSITSGYQPSIPRIRLQLMIRGLRLYQMMEGVTRFRELTARVVSPADVWRYLTPIDPDGEPARRVLGNFEQNLREMAALADHSGAAALVIPPLTNLKDWPPLVSALGKNISPRARAEWETFWRKGQEKESSGDEAGALEAYRKAAEIDDRHAELCWRIGQLLLKNGNPREAKQWLVRARDRDWVISRAPSAILEATRRAVRGTKAILVENVPDKDPETWIPGGDEIYDNVHPTFEGNWLLAAACFPHVVRLLAGPDTSVSPEPPDRETVRSRLALTPAEEAEHCEIVQGMLQWGGSSLENMLAGIARRKQSLEEQARLMDNDPTQALMRVWQKHPDDYWIGTRLYWNLFNSSRKDEASAVLQKLAPAHPARRGVQRAKLQLELPRLDAHSRKDALLTFLRRFPDDGQGWELLARHCLDSEDHAGAILYARRALREDLTLNGARVLLARALEQSGQVQGALHTAAEALTLDLGDTAALELVDRITGNYTAEEKSAFWGEIVRKNPGCWPARLRELEALRDCGRDKPEAWLRLLDYARTCGPRAWPAQYEASRALNRGVEELLEILATAIRWNPDDFRPYDEADRALSTDLSARIRFWESLAGEISACRIWFHLGRAREAEENIPAAVDAYRKAASGCPDDPAMLASLGFALIKLGQSGDALEPLSRAASINPDIPGIHEAIQQARDAQSP